MGGSFWAGGGRKGLVPGMGEAPFLLGAGWREMPLAAKAPAAGAAAGLRGLTGRGRGVGLQEEAPGPRTKSPGSGPRRGGRSLSTGVCKGACAAGGLAVSTIMRPRGRPWVRARRPPGLP